MSDSSSGGACDNYRVDVAAARFGDCKCGFPKADHKNTAGSAPAVELRWLATCRRVGADLGRGGDGICRWSVR